MKIYRIASLDMVAVEKKLQPYIDEYIRSSVDRSWELPPDDPRYIRLKDAVNKLIEASDLIICKLYEMKDVTSLESLANFLKEHDAGIAAFYCYQAIENIKKIR